MYGRLLILASICVNCVNSSASYFSVNTSFSPPASESASTLSILVYSICSWTAGEEELPRGIGMVAGILKLIITGAVLSHCVTMTSSIGAINTGADHVTQYG